jgi:hypothetical protein
MSWPLLWTPEGDADLLTLHYETAHVIGRAVRMWVETADGMAELLDGDRIRIFAPGAGHATIKLDEKLGAFFVLRVYADNPLPSVVPLLDEPDDGDDD